MKTWLTLCLLAFSAAATAQTAKPAKDEKVQAARTEAQSEADEAKTRKELAEARERLDKAAREVAVLSNKLGDRARREVRIIEGGPRRAVLGIQIDADPANKARVSSA